MASNILVIPDPHFTPGTDHSRATWAARLVLHKKPDVIVCLGDWAEMPSLSMYDAGKVSSEGQRYQADIEAAKEALNLFHSEIDKYNNRLRALHKRTYLPQFVMVKGNHEARIDRARQENPKFYDTISVDDLGFNSKGWEIKDTTSPTVIEGIAFAHYFTSGVMGRPICGPNHGRNLLVKNHMSTVVGHSHLLDYSMDINAEGKQIFGLVCGCYFDYQMNWTTENKRYWRGLVYLHDCADGMCYPEFLGIDHIRSKYGN